MSGEGGAGIPRENIRVVCRFRPLNKIELQKAGGDGKCMIGSLTDDSVVCTTSDGNSYTFAFDRIFGTNSVQPDVYRYAALPVVDCLFQGFNGCLLAYGQTGSGKTHTMMGADISDSGAKGIIPRVVDEIFDRALHAGSEMEFSIRVAFVEIYCERIRDLFEPKHDNLQVGEDPIAGVYIKGVTEYYVTSREEVLALMEQGNDNRAVSATGMNAGSSRSHSLFLLSLTQKNAVTGEATSGKLYLVDLAGSETVSKTGVSGQQLEELKKINKSLSSLGNVINALTDGKSSHIPYRDSKLTRVLQECVGGNAKTTLIIACSPSSWNEMETLSTLRFGKRAKRIVNRAMVNKERSPEEMKKSISILENAVSALVRLAKSWVHGAEGGHLVLKPGVVGGESFDLPALVRSSLACIAAGAAALEGKDMEVIEPPPETPGLVEKAVSVLTTTTETGEPEDEPSGVTDGSDAADATSKIASEEDVPHLAAEKAELERTNATLIELLKEAGEELRRLRAAEGEAKARNEQLQDQIETMHTVLSERDMRIRRLSEESGIQRPDAHAGEGAMMPPTSPRGDTEVLRANYHRALTENEELKAEIADLQARISELEQRMGSAESSTPSPPSELQLALGSARSPVPQYAGDVRFSPCTIYEVIWEHQRYAKDTGWVTEPSSTPRSVPRWCGAFCMPGEANKESIEAANAALQAANPADMLPSPLMSSAVSRVMRPKESVALPSSQWYWSKDWYVDTLVDETEFLEAGWQLPMNHGDSKPARQPIVNVHLQRDSEGWQYAPAWESFGSEEGAHHLQRPSDLVRRRRWLRPRVFIDMTDLEGSQKHMLGLASQLEVKDHMMTRMAEELAARQSTIRAYEDRMSQMMVRMARAVETGDMTLIGQGAADVSIGVHGSRIRGAPPQSRSIKGGQLAHGDRQSLDSSGRPSTEPGLLNTLTSVWRRFSSSPYKAGERPAEPADSAQASAAAQELMDASEKGPLAAVQGILRSNPLSINCEDKVGRTPLLYAARGGQLAILQYLASIGADMHACDKDGRNALHYAARRGHVDAAAWLLKMGLSVRQTDVHALTPLHQATLGKSVAMIQLLVKAGADVNARDANGCTALKLAQRFDASSGDNPIVTLLLPLSDAS